MSFEEAGNNEGEKPLLLGVDTETLNKLVEIFQSVEKDPRKFKRYINAAIRLREIERQTGKSFHVLSREYEKMLRESIKLEYLINELKEKRRRMEDDLRIYMEQQNLTLEQVNKVSKLFILLEKNGLSLTDLETFVNTIKNLKEMDWDIGKLMATLNSIEDISKEIERLEDRRREAESELANIENQIKRRTEELSELLSVEPEVNKIIEARENLRHKVEEMENSLNSLKSELEKLMEEYRMLMDFKGSARELVEELNRRKKLLEELDAEINRKKEDLKLFEEEMDIARSLFAFMESIETIKPEELETLSEQIRYAARVKRGGIPAVKSLEKHLVENARDKLIQLILPAVKGKFVPIEVFNKLEKEYREQMSKKERLEEEISELRQIISRLTEKLESKAAERSVSMAEEYDKFRLESTGEFVSRLSDRKARLKCPYCKGINPIYLPDAEELRSLSEKEERLFIVCRECSQKITVPADYILRFFEEV